MTPSLPGFATPEGTQRFAERAQAHAGSTGPIPPEHFRTTPQGLTLTSLGMGTYLGNPDAATSAQVTAAAVESVKSGAINVLDTAINYRYQLAERSLKTALEELAQSGISRDELFIASKNGFITPDAESSEEFRAFFKQHFLDSGLMMPNDIAGGMHCMHPNYLNDQLNTSLKNLGLETLDLMYLHNASESQLPAVGRAVFMERLKAAFEFYEGARRDGRIRYYGMATWNCFRVPPEAATDYLSLETVVKLAEETGGPDHGFRFVQLPVNLAFMEAMTLKAQPVNGENHTFLEAAQKLGIGVFTSVPILQGQLLAQPGLPQFPGLTTPAQQCLQFVRSTPGILAPLIGQKNPQHVAENLTLANVAPLSPEAFEAMFLAESAR